ncbi:MAG: dTDP-4-amino-4,6-dideoxygalactose transaminase [Candidatus Omnitrophica bacterium]|jgi:dTDP-4-amino-4,6-dideoxygalactose transaminase|nr:dTDP-4-amino-4,6-dideoxygalactose transaminase [Candidatus Omnitrophota bacterium]
MIPFSKPVIFKSAEKYIKDVLHSGKLSGDHDFTKRCNAWLENRAKTKKVFLTTSCTHALEMAALLINIKEGDEVIMPSYSFSSTPNAFVLRGATIVFVDIRPDTMNIDETLIEPAITNKTKAIVPVHYAGVGCAMDAIIEIAKKYNLFVIEDAAQGLMSTYKGRTLGAIGNIGAYSFHETKNYSSGEGGAILINDDKFIKRAEIIREKGTNRSQFFRGEIDKYSWQDVGSSYLPSELNAALLFSQLEMADKINKNRLKSWNYYYTTLKPLEKKGHLELPKIPAECKHNAHIFYIKVNNITERSKLIKYLKDKNINALFHYVPLHGSKAGKNYGRFSGQDKFTTIESERLLRLPLYYNMSLSEAELVCEIIKKYFVKGG